MGSVLYLYDHVYVSSCCREGLLQTKMVYTFERMTLNRVTQRAWSSLSLSWRRKCFLLRWNTYTATEEIVVVIVVIAQLSLQL